MFTEEAVRALILSTFAGLSTMIGALIIVFTKKNNVKCNEKLISVSLGFAAGVMISVSMTDLFPIANDSLVALYNNNVLGVLLAVVFLVAGMLLAALLDHFVPHQEYDEEKGETPHKNLLRVGFVSMLAIVLPFE